MISLAPAICSVFMVIPGVGRTHWFPPHSCQMTRPFSKHLLDTLSSTVLTHSFVPVRSRLQLMLALDDPSEKNEDGHRYCTKLNAV